MRVTAALVFILFLPPAGLAAGDEITLPGLLKALASSSPELKKEEAVLRKAQSAYREQMSFLSPTLLFNAPAGFMFTPFYDFYYTPGSSTAVADSSVWDFSPNLSLTQFLPTSGTLDFSVKNTLQVIDLGDLVNPGSLPPGAPPIPDNAFIDELTVSLSLRQPIFFENAFAASLTIIEETYRTAQARFLMARNALVARAARDYFGLARLEAAARLAELSLADARLSAADARKKLETGSVSPLAALKEETRLRKAELDSFDAGRALRDERIRLASVYGIDREAAIGREAADGEGAAPLVLPELPGEEELRSRALAANPEILMARQEHEARKAKAITTRCENAHTLTLGGNLVLDSVNDYETDLWSALAGPFTSSANPRLSFTLKLSLRLFDGGAAAEKARQAELDAETTGYALAGKTVEVAGRIDRAAGGLERARLNAGYAAAVLEVAAREFEAARRDFAAGRIARLDLDRLELAFRSAGLEDLGAKGDVDLARLEMFALMGDDLYGMLAGGKP